MTDPTEDRADPTPVPTQPIRVVLVDDQPLVRVGIKAFLERSADICVVGEAADGRAGMSAVRSLLPDVVLMDIRMPELDGLAATRQIIADPALAAVKVLILSTFDADDYVFDAIRIGASGFLLKDAEPEDLRRAVRVVAAGESLLAPSITARVMQAAASHHHNRPTAAARARIEVLTEREREVLTQVGFGRSNEEIARVLVISPATARTHVSRVMTKLHARDRAQLVVLAYESGVVRPGSGPDGGA